MLYKIGSSKDLAALPCALPDCVMTELACDIEILDREYGADRNWQESGGYSVIVETREDLRALNAIVDTEKHPCEWANRLSQNRDWLSTLFLFGDDFSIKVYMPVTIAPISILRDLEEYK